MNRYVPDIREYYPLFFQLLPVVVGLNSSENLRLFEPLGAVEAVPNDSAECHRGERSCVVVVVERARVVW